MDVCTLWSGTEGNNVEGDLNGRGIERPSVELHLKDFLLSNIFIYLNGIHNCSVRVS